MKKLCTILFFVFISTFSYGQICTADTTFSTGYISPTRLPNASVGTPYELTISFKVPKDTSLPYQGTVYSGTIDSAQVIYMKNIPKGFSYQCNKTSCTWKGGTFGCALLKGTPDSSNLNKYEIKVYVQTWVTVTQFGLQINRIDSSTIDLNIIGGQVGIQEKFAGNKPLIYPNPTQNELTIENAVSFQPGAFANMMDIQGRLVKNIILQGLKNHFDISELPEGAYILSVYNGDKQYKEKVIISR